MPCGATQDRWVMVEGSDRMWSPGEGNGKPLQYPALRTPWTACNMCTVAKITVFSYINTERHLRSLVHFHYIFNCMLSLSRNSEALTCAYSRLSSWPPCNQLQPHTCFMPKPSWCFSSQLLSSSSKIQTMGRWGIPAMKRQNDLKAMGDPAVIFNRKRGWKNRHVLTHVMNSTECNTYYSHIACCSLFSAKDYHC